MSSTRLNYCGRMMYQFLLLQSLFLLLFLPSVTSLEIQRPPPPPSLLVNTQWKLGLDIGLQPGTWMPKRFPGWAESGARLGLSVNVEFTSEPCLESEILVGPSDDTFQLRVISKQPSTFVSERGEESVKFISGGWCIQRPTGDIRNAKGTLVKPEGLLRFWLDCPTGAKRRDVEIFANTRIFFTTGVWDDPLYVESKDNEYKMVLTELQQLVEQTKETSKEYNSSKNNNPIKSLTSFRQMVSDSKRFDILKEKKERFERELPPVGAVEALNGVQLAPNGSLVMKNQKQKLFWLPGTEEYLILGTFSTGLCR